MATADLMFPTFYTPTSLPTSGRPPCVMGEKKEMDPESNLRSYIQKVRAILEIHGVVVPSHCDQFIVRCLRVKKYDLEKTATLLKNFGAMMRMEESLDLYSKFQPSTFKNFYFGGATSPLLHKDSRGRLILYGRAGCWKVNEYDFDQAIAAFIVMLNYCIGRSPEVQRCGIVVIFDFRGWNYQQIRSVKIRRLKLLVKIVQDSSPAKLKALHVIYHPRIVRFLMALVKPFMKEKLANRIHFHGDDQASLHQHIEPSILPEILGGTVSNDEYIDKPVLHALMAEDQFCHDMLKCGFPVC